MQYQRFWQDLQKLTVNSLAPRLLAGLPLSLSLAVATSVLMQIGQQHANASTVPIWQFDPATNELIIALPEGTIPKYSVLNSNQIAIDLPNTEIGIDATQLYPKGLVNSVGLSQNQPGVARIVMQLAPGFALVPDRTQFQKVGASNRWVVVPAIAPSATRNTTQTQAPSATQAPQSVTFRTPNSVAPQESVSPSAIGTQTYDRNPSQQTNQNDQIRPITLPLIRVATGERRGVSIAPVSRPTAPEQRVINFGEPLPR